MRAETRCAGFTLLEVLAAVAVLALVYTVLATAAIQGLRAEGDAGRRLRASLLADQRITEIEAQVATGQTPDIGESESREEEFTVRTVVKPLDLAIAQTKTSKRAKERASRAVGGTPAGAPAATAATAAGTPPGTPKAPSERKSLLHPTTGSKQPMLRRIDLSVSWAEGESEQSVRRTTFGIDAVAAAPLIEELVAAADAEKAQAAQKQGTSPTPSGTGKSGSSNSSGSGSGSSTGTSTGFPGTGPGSPSQGLRSVPPTGTDMSNSMGGDR